MIAKLRWRKVGQKARLFRSERHIFELQDGREFEIFSRDTELIKIIEQLPLHYLELGNKAADMKSLLSRSEREATARVKELEERLATWQQRFDALPESEKIIPILSSDLELALNMIIRFAQALGIHPRGELYNGINKLLSKYNMIYKYQNNGLRLDEATSDIITAKLNMETGKLGFTPVSGPISEDTA